MLKTRSRTVSAGGSRLAEVPVKLALFDWRDNPPWMPPQRNAPNWPPYVQYGVMKFREPVYTALYEKIRSDDDPCTRNVWKPCQHYKRWLMPPRASSVRSQFREVGYIKRYNSLYALSAIPTWWHAANSTRFVSNFGVYGNHLLGLPDMYTAEVPGTGDFISKPANLSVLIDNGFRALLPRIKEEMSLVNSVLELPELKSLPKTLSKVIELGKMLASTPSLYGKLADLAKRAVKIPKKYRSFRASFARSYGATLAESTRVAADVTLQEQFGIEPLLRDICGYHRALVTLSRKINDLVARQGKLQIKHFRCPIATPSTNYGKTVPNVQANSGCFSSFQTLGWSGEPYPTYVYNMPQDLWTITRSTSHKSMFHMQLEYTYAFDAFSLRNAEILGFLDALGVNLNPAIIWNAIPWSFVIDWLVPIGKWLDSYKRLNLEPVVNIRRSLWSVKHERVTILSLSGGVVQPYFDAYISPGTTLHTVRETAYRREPNLVSDSSFVMSGLTLKQWVLAAALARTRRWRPKWTIR